MKRRLPVILLFVAIILVLIGLKLGEFKMVLEKAISICLSCVGIS